MTQNQTPKNDPFGAVGHVNQSGFPLQIALEQVVKKEGDSSRWRVRYREHAWKSARTGQAGFIDLVIEDRNDSLILAIESKRRLDASWTFFRPDGGSGERTRFRAYVTNREGGVLRHSRWTEVQFAPGSDEAVFAVVRGQDASGAASMIERSGSELISGIEALVHQETDFLPRARADHFRCYVGVIVTNAQLLLCTFNAAGITLSDGMLDSSAAVTSVPYIRLRKQLNPSVRGLTPTDYEDHQMRRGVAPLSRRVFGLDLKPVEVAR